MSHISLGGQSVPGAREAASACGWQCHRRIDEKINSHYNSFSAGARTSASDSCVFSAKLVINRPVFVIVSI